VPAEPTPRRLALVVHPARPIDEALASIARWATGHGLDLVQLRTEGGREVAAPGELAEGDLVVAVGGDGTVLSALRAAAPHDAPVLGVACGSLGALTAVAADRLADALDRVRAGDWAPRRLPALSVRAQDEAPDWAANDFVVVRHGPGQLVADVAVDGELYVRLAGDGVIVATPMGSSAYSMAAGGPLLAPDAPAYVCTPLAMHGGSAAPLVVPASATVAIDVHPGYAGFHVDLDGHRRAIEARHFELSLHPDKLTLVAFEAPGRGGLAGLRRRGLFADSPRVLARDDRSTR
jgi:NAD+ kinase